MTLDWDEAARWSPRPSAAGVRFSSARTTATGRGAHAAAGDRVGPLRPPHLSTWSTTATAPFPRTLDYPGAMVWDMACHHFDNLIHLFGPSAARPAVTHGAPWSPYAHDAGVTAALEFARGPVCSYVLTHQATVPDYRWTLQSEAGMLRTAGQGAWEWVPRGPVQQFAVGGTPEPVEDVPPLRSEQGVVDDWLAWIEGGAEPGISGRHNLETLATCEMVLRSAASRRAVDRSSSERGSPSHSDLEEHHARRRADLEDLARRLQRPARAVDPERHDGVGVLVGGQQERAARVEVEVARRPPTGRLVAAGAQAPGGLVDREDRDRVVAAVRGVDEPSARVGHDLRGRVLPASSRAAASRRARRRQGAALAVVPDRLIVESISLST